jgi:hypothetical protein
VLHSMAKDLIDTMREEGKAAHSGKPAI